MEEKNKNNNRKLILSIIGVLLLVALVIGITYAAWNYTFNGTKVSSLSTADIKLELLESDDNVISIANALPMSDAQGKAQTTYFDFVVTSKTVRDIAVGYTISLEKLSVDSGYTSLNDNQIKVYLTNTSDTQIVAPTLISGLTNYRLYSDAHEHDSNHNKVQSKYRLRVWIDSEVDASSWTSATKYQYKFRLNASGEEKNKYTVNISVTNGTITGDSTKRIRIGETGTFTVSPNSGYENGTVSCTNSQTATLSGTTLTTGAITNDTTCTVTYTVSSSWHYSSYYDDSDFCTDGCPGYCSSNYSTSVWSCSSNTPASASLSSGGSCWCKY